MPRPSKFTMRAACLLSLLGCLLLPPRPAAAQEPPLPDLQTFLTEARRHLATDDARQSQYTYLERRADVRVSALARVSTGPVKVWQVFPGDGEIETYRRLIEVDGRPVSPGDLEKQDRRRRAEVLDLVQKRARESAADRRKRLDRQAERAREAQLEIDDVFRVLDFMMVGRSMIDGRPAIELAFSPKAGVKARTDSGKLVAKTRGRVFVSEADMLQDISMGLGLGKLYKGATASFERTKVNDEVWLPARATFTASGRAVLRKFAIDQIVSFSDYRRLSADTATSFTLPVD